YKGPWVVLPKLDDKILEFYGLKRKKFACTNPACMSEFASKRLLETHVKSGCWVLNYQKQQNYQWLRFVPEKEIETRYPCTNTSCLKAFKNEHARRRLLRDGENKVRIQVRCNFRGSEDYGGARGGKSL
ncbi:GSCOCG00002828001-RA-CDS, partial [Cotesia congregata]